MRVFVLGTGRCGSTTFATACGHFDNYTAEHESRVRLVGYDRFDYPDDHIEADNRLSWLLGQLGRRFDGTDVLYVHLRRDRHDVIDSFLARWDAPFKTNIMRAFGHGIIMRTRDWSEAEAEDLCAFYVDVVTANIEEFLRGRPSMEMQLESLDQQFAAFVDRIGAAGDLDGARAELGIRHNRR